MSQVICNDFIWPMFAGLDEDNNNLISYHLAENGIYCRKNVFGNKYIVYKDDKVADLPKIEENLHPIKDSKIPAVLFYKTLDFFKHVYKHFGVWLEAFVIYGMNKDGKYFIYIPEQDVQGAHVHADLDDFYKNNPGCYIVADTHSHANFGAYFSGIDNSDDIKGRYSCVVGNNAKVVPDVKCRFNYAGKYVDLTIEDIFEDNDNYIEQDYNMDEWVKKLSYKKETVVVDGSCLNIISSNMYDDDAYGSYYSTNGFFRNKRSGNHGNFTRRDNQQNNSVVPVVEKCTQCGKFTNVANLFQIEAELLCSRCLVELGLG